MFKYVFCSVLVLLATPSYSQEMSSSPTSSTIHTITVQADWYGNLSVSTKLGKRSAEGLCVYNYETPPHGFDLEKTFYLNAYFLEKNAGVTYNCAATHIRLATGEEGLDEYDLVLDKKGAHYTYTHPAYGHVNLG